MMKELVLINAASHIYCHLDARFNDYLDVVICGDSLTDVESKELSLALLSGLCHYLREEESYFYAFLYQCMGSLSRIVDSIDPVISLPVVSALIYEHPSSVPSSLLLESHPYCVSDSEDQ